MLRPRLLLLLIALTLLAPLVSYTITVHVPTQEPASGPGSQAGPFEIELKPAIPKAYGLDIISFF
jgi:biopolymer transport protein ExbD